MNGSSELPKDLADRMIEAVNEGDEQAVRELLAENPALVGAREDGSTHTALHVAAGCGNAAMVKLLLDAGADPNAVEEGDNALPLHFAAERGWLDVVKLLVKARSDVNWTLDLHHRGPLGWAVVFGQVQTEVAEYLIEHGAKLDLFSAIGLGKKEVVEQLVGEDPYLLRQRMSKFELFKSPIEFAMEVKQPKIALFLVEAGSEVSLSDAAAMGDLEEAAERLDGLVNQFQLDSALRSAVLAGQTGTAELLLVAKANPNYAVYGRSILFDAIGAGDKEMARLLLKCGADLEFKDSHWNSSPLGWQVFFGRPAETELCLELGAQVDSNLLELAEAGERGELRRHSSGSTEEYRQTHEVLQSHSQ